MKAILKSRGMMTRFSQEGTILMLPVNFYLVMLSFLAYWTLWAGSFSVNNEPWLVRTISHVTGTRVKSFCDTVCSRDLRCVISGEKAVGASFDDWTGFEAAHIFPLAYEGHWIKHGYDRWITIRPELGGTINSVQNGMLLDSAVHQLFDSYNLSINPDVWMRCILIKDIVANNYLRIISRSCSSPSIGKVLLASIWTKSFLMILNDLSISFCDGTSGRPS